MSSVAEVVSEVPPATRSIIYLGMDVHKESITIAVLPQGAKSPTHVDRLPNDLLKLKRFLERIARDGELRACYEASGAGYVLHRAMKEWGYQCDVIAPSLIPRRPGVQRKHDKYDAAELAGSIVPASWSSSGFPPRPRSECVMSFAAERHFRRRSSSHATTS